MSTDLNSNCNVIEVGQTYKHFQNPSSKFNILKIDDTEVHFKDRKGQEKHTHINTFIYWLTGKENERSEEIKSLPSKIRRKKERNKWKFNID